MVFGTRHDCKLLKIINPEEQDKIEISVYFNPGNYLLHVKARGNSETETFCNLKEGI